MKRECVKFVATELLIELEGSRLEVVLTPAPDSRHATHMVRAVADQNADWYRDFCAEYSTYRGARGSRRTTLRRKPDTRIKRADTVRGLEQIIEGGRANVYVERLMEVVRKNHRRLCACALKPVPPPQPLCRCRVGSR